MDSAGECRVRGGRGRASGESERLEGGSGAGEGGFRCNWTSSARSNYTDKTRYFCKNEVMHAYM